MSGHTETLGRLEDAIMRKAQQQAAIEMSDLFAALNLVLRTKCGIQDLSNEYLEISQENLGQVLAEIEGYATRLMAQKLAKHMANSLLEREEDYLHQLESEDGHD
jgi:hypothetical protein